MGFSGDMERLQDIIEKFEADDLEMEESLALFEEGVRLIKSCREYLDGARRKVTMLTSDREVESGLDNAQYT
ncbi:MAG: exodeoxyribonuclease VII small subunit [Synergistaceae bacterium]|jgi:exodeoxyribonuclease VII small subunit|nr:exodeoxyribonuclease VII small subunit [Synergistaceae bacterium]